MAFLRSVYAGRVCT